MEDVFVNAVRTACRKDVLELLPAETILNLASREDTAFKSRGRVGTGKEIPLTPLLKLVNIVMETAPAEAASAGSGGTRVTNADAKEPILLRIWRGWTSGIGRQESGVSVRLRPSAGILQPLNKKGVAAGTLALGNTAHILMKHGCLI